LKSSLKKFEESVSSGIADRHKTEEEKKQDRILRFVDLFVGKGWVGARDVSRWWSTKSRPSSGECRSFMVGVVDLGYARSNGEPSSSSKFQIKIQTSADSADNADKMDETKSKQGFQSLAVVPTNADKNADNADKTQKVPTKIDDSTDPDVAIETSACQIPGSVGTRVGNSTDNPEDMLEVSSSHSVGNSSAFVGNSTDNPEASSSHFVGIVGTVSEKISTLSDRSSTQSIDDRSVDRGFDFLAGTLGDFPVGTLRERTDSADLAVGDLVLWRGDEFVVIEVDGDRIKLEGDNGYKPTLSLAESMASRSDRIEKVGSKGVLGESSDDDRLWDFLPEEI
jgi:hypothetical protein